MIPPPFGTSGTGIGDLPSETRENVPTAGIDIAFVAREPGSTAWSGADLYIGVRGWG